MSRLHAAILCLVPLPGAPDVPVQKMLDLTASGDLEHVGVATPDGSRSYGIFYGHLQGKSINSSLVVQL